MYLHVANAFYWLILVSFLLKIVIVERCPLLVQRCTLGGAVFNRIRG